MTVYKSTIKPTKDNENMVLPEKEKKRKKERKNSINYDANKDDSNYKCKYH